MDVLIFLHVKKFSKIVFICSKLQKSSQCFQTKNINISVSDVGLGDGLLACVSGVRLFHFAPGPQDARCLLLLLALQTHRVPRHGLCLLIKTCFIFVKYQIISLIGVNICLIFNISFAYVLHTKVFIAGSNFEQQTTVMIQTANVFVNKFKTIKVKLKVLIMIMSKLSNNSKV